MKKLLNVTIKFMKLKEIVTHDDFSICNRNDLVDISETNCIPPLLNSKRYDCIVINNHDLP